MMNKPRYSNLSLFNLVIAFVFLVLYIPSLGLLLLHRVINEGVQDRLEEQRLLIKDIDESINYDHRITKVTGVIVSETSDRIIQDFYNSNGDKIARDVYFQTPDDSMELKSRTYYDKLENIIALDTYDFPNDILVSEIYEPNVVKQREYFNQNGEMILCEYFNMYGVPIEFLTARDICGLRETTLLSPLPPLFFFYR